MGYHAGPMRIWSWDWIVIESQMSYCLHFNYCLLGKNVLLKFRFCVRRWLTSGMLPRVSWQNLSHVSEVLTSSVVWTLSHLIPNQCVQTIVVFLICNVQKILRQKLHIVWRFIIVLDLIKICLLVQRWNVDIHTGNIVISKRIFPLIKQRK